MRAVRVLLAILLCLALGSCSGSTSVSRSMSVQEHVHLIAHNFAYNFARERAHRRSKIFAAQLPETTVSYTHPLFRIINRGHIRVKRSTNNVGHKNVFNLPKIRRVAQIYAVELSDAMIIGALRRAFNKVKSGFQNVANKVKHGVQQVAHKAKHGVQHAVHKLKTGAHGAMHQVAGFAKSQANHFVKDYILSYKDVIKQAKNVFHTAAGGAIKFGRTMASGGKKFGQSIGRSAAMAGGYLGNAARGAGKFVIASGRTVGNFARATNFKNFAVMGGQLFRGDINGMRNNWNKQADQYKKTAAMTAGNFKQLANDYKSEMNQASAALRKGLVGEFAKTKEALKELGKGFIEAGKDLYKLYKEVDKLFDSHPLLKMLKEFSPLGVADTVRMLVKYGKDGQWANFALGLVDKVADVAAYIPKIGTVVSAALNTCSTMARFGIAMSQGRHEDALRELANIKLPLPGGAGKVINGAAKGVKYGFKAYDIANELSGGKLRPQDGSNESNEEV
ncbi:synuclein [Acrasis kona]|uniref:Synuclein n=1 Tax=Acrasis kona TaxID=1008807 RepID=A0AAW2ZFU1_9EUKA